MDWKITIKKGTPECIHCKRAFEDDEEYVSALYEDESVDYLRYDYCQSCWEKEARPGYFSLWKAVFSLDEKKKNRLDIEAVYDIFESLYENTYEQMQSPERRDKMCYILGLMLMRKKILSLRGTKENDGRSMLVMKKVREEKIFEVIVPKITELEISALRDDVFSLLGLEVPNEAGSENEPEEDEQGSPGNEPHLTN